MASCLSLLPLCHVTLAIIGPLCLSFLSLYHPASATRREDQRPGNLILEAEMGMDTIRVHSTISSICESVLGISFNCSAWLRTGLVRSWPGWRCYLHFTALLFVSSVSIFSSEWILLLEVITFMKKDITMRSSVHGCWPLRSSNKRIGTVQYLTQKREKHSSGDQTP